MDAVNGHVMFYFGCGRFHTAQPRKAQAGIIKYLIVISPCPPTPSLWGKNGYRSSRKQCWALIYSAATKTPPATASQSPLPPTAPAAALGSPVVVGSEAAAPVVPVGWPSLSEEEEEREVRVVVEGTPALSDVVVSDGRTNVAVGTGAVAVAPVALPVMGPGPWLPEAV